MSRVRERRNASLKRQRQIRAPYDTVLIVCEGSKTEPDYFKELKNELRLSNANIHICGKECGTAPESVVKYALGELKKDPTYDRIFCVFDKDQHKSYQAAIGQIKAKKKFKVITSVPCFEFWLLLHFRDAARPYVKAGNKSACDNAIRDLKMYIPDYEKGSKIAFEKTYPTVSDAIKRAQLLEIRQQKAGTDNPSTKVHHLISYLQGLGKTKKAVQKSNRKLHG